MTSKMSSSSSRTRETTRNPALPPDCPLPGAVLQLEKKKKNQKEEQTAFPVRGQTTRTGFSPLED